jgi:hypothetical protein
MLELIEAFYRKSLGKPISYLVLGRDEPDIQTILRNTFTNKMVVYLNMLGTSMEDKID